MTVYGVEVPSYLFGFISAVCIIALLWTVAVIGEEFVRTRGGSSLRVYRHEEDETGVDSQ